MENRIKNIVSEHLNVPLPIMEGAIKTREVSFARMFAMAFIREYTDHSLNKIGSFFGKRDHTTVIHAEKTISDLRSTYKPIEAQYQAIFKKIELACSKEERKQRLDWIKAKEIDEGFNKCQNKRYSKAA